MEPFFHLAFLTDPKYLDAKYKRYVTNDEVQDVLTWLNERNEKYGALFNKFRIKDPDLIPASMFEKHMMDMNASDWWLVMRNHAENETNPDEDLISFCSLLISLGKSPASSAGIERWFSTLGFVWSKTRNKLGIDKARKLAIIYRALNKDRIVKRWKSKTYSGTASGSGGGDNDEADSGDDDDAADVSDDDIDLNDVFSDLDESEDDLLEETDP